MNWENYTLEKEECDKFVSLEVHIPISRKLLRMLAPILRDKNEAVWTAIDFILVGNLNCS